MLPPTMRTRLPEGFGVGAGDTTEAFSLSNSVFFTPHIGQSSGGFSPLRLKLQDLQIQRAGSPAAVSGLGTGRAVPVEVRSSSSGAGSNFARRAAQTGQNGGGSNATCRCPHAEQRHLGSSPSARSALCPFSLF